MKTQCCPLERRGDGLNCKERSWMVNEFGTYHISELRRDAAGKGLDDCFHEIIIRY